MITATQIKGGAGYMKSHLSANDYYSEHEKIEGHWKGEAAKMLGIEGQVVTTEAFEALRTNKHPISGEKLRSRTTEGRFHDIVISCPKTISVAALVGGDDRLVKAFEEVVDRTFKRLELYASRRERKGKAYNTENTIRTGNGVAAVYHHDTSRLLDPQLHAHCVFSNHTWCEKEQQWFALQPRQMLEESKLTIRQEFYKDMARECRKLGYDVQWQYDPAQEQHVPRLTAISPQMELLYSQRKLQKKHFIRRYTDTFGLKPDMKRVEQFIKETKGPATRRFVAEFEQAYGRKSKAQEIGSFVQDWRSSKMAKSTAEEVSAGQLNRMTTEQSQHLEQVVANARQKDEPAQAAAQNMTPEAPVEQQVVAAPKQDVDALKHEPASNKNQATENRLRPISNGERVAKAQMETLRALKRGASILRALNGHPATFIARELARGARSRSKEQTS